MCLVNFLSINKNLEIVSDGHIPQCLLSEPKQTRRWTFCVSAARGGCWLMLVHWSGGENSFISSPAADFHREVRGHGSGSGTEWRPRSCLRLAQGHMRSGGLVRTVQVFSAGAAGGIKKHVNSFDLTDSSQVYWCTQQCSVWFMSFQRHPVEFVIICVSHTPADGFALFFLIDSWWRWRAKKRRNVPTKARTQTM